MKRNKLFTAVVALGLVLSFSLTAYAHDVPDSTRRGSITVTVQDGGDSVPGGTVTLYRVGEVVENDGNYSFQPTGAFADCGESFENLEAANDLAERLRKFAAEKQITGLSTRDINEMGIVRFGDLELGLYLVVQNKAAAGYEKLAPFLVSVPYMWNGSYIYDVSSRPKTELEKTPVPTEPQPTKPSGPNLPQTGQLWWPVPVLACGGLLLFAVGMALNRRRERE